MGWAVGFDSRWNRDIGYGVPATCDYPGCGTAIDRGLGHVCGGEPYGGEKGCGLFFCASHLLVVGVCQISQRCDRCARGSRSTEPYEATPDTAEWLHWKLTDQSWADWRDLNAAEVMRIREVLAADEFTADLHADLDPNRDESDQP